VLWRCWLGGRKGIRPVKNWVVGFWRAGVVICLEQCADLHMAQLIPPPLIVSCFSKIQIGFTFPTKQDVQNKHLFITWQLSGYFHTPAVLYIIRFWLDYVGSSTRLCCWRLSVGKCLRRGAACTHTQTDGHRENSVPSEPRLWDGLRHRNKPTHVYNDIHAQSRSICTLCYRVFDAIVVQLSANIHNYGNF